MTFSKNMDEEELLDQHNMNITYTIQNNQGNNANNVIIDD